MRKALFTSTALVGLLALGLGCKHESAAQQQADQAAQQETDRVTQLQKELDDLKAGKTPDGEDADASKTVKAAHMKALQRQLADAEKRAAKAKQQAAQLAATPAAPKTTSVTVPSGTPLSIQLAQDLSTDKQHEGDPWSGTLTSDVAVGGVTAWPAGTQVSGVVTQSVPAGRLSSGKGVLAIKVTAIGDNSVDSDTHAVAGDPKGTRDAKYIGGGAAIGALIGILADKNHKNDHALGGAAIGAAAGTAVAAGTADTVIKIPASAPLKFTLGSNETVVVKN